MDLENRIARDDRALPASVSIRRQSSHRSLDISRELRSDLVGVAHHTPHMRDRHAPTLAR